MKWMRIEAGDYRSVSPKTYTITREGVGLFREGWRPSWKLRRKGEDFVMEFGSLKAAKAGAEKRQELVRMGRRRFIKKHIKGHIGEIKKKYIIHIAAVHEAGHILVEGITSNRRIISATCMPGDGYDGRVVLAVPPRKAVDTRAAKGMIMSGLAGNVAEALVFDLAFDLQSLNDTDKEDLLEYGPELCGSRQLDEFALSLAEETLELLRNNQESLRLLANQ